ncbi:MAG: GxxExxY protein [Holophagaceae bacterium]|uniref:GxxExxY protein n=1 Tax=Candidatus Geothrix skivensis TaxID=2954439 RepID=A0A9D7XI12_9BACT|nr:GxxExxY protein [Candidatus Geothrix skivensis]
MAVGENAMNELSGRVIGAAMRVHSTLGSGFTEAVYQNALALEMALEGIPFEREVNLEVRYRGEMVGLYRADLVVAGVLILELKAVQAILPEHEVQVVNYLAATGLEHALLLNFGTKSLQLKKKFRNFRPS